MALLTQIAICNIALTQLGANSINSLSEGSTESVTCNIYWDSARTSLLNAHPWNFAIKRVELPRETTSPLYEFKYKYTKPADCIRILQVFNDGEYRIEGNSIVTDSQSCFIKYVADITDTSAWSVGFKDAMVARMRFDLAYPLTKSSNEVATASQIYDMALRNAKAIDASEDIGDAINQFDNTLLTVRG